jgi:hypothetical protein
MRFLKPFEHARRPVRSVNDLEAEHLIVGQRAAGCDQTAAPPLSPSAAV